MKRICVAIAASRAAPLESLPGAVVAAEDIGRWATASGFDIVRVVTDAKKDEPVTIERLRKILSEVLADDGDEIETFIIHFAGHGFRSGAEQNLWLPTDWHNEMRAISVEALRTKLYRHGIQNLTIFSDACRSLPNDIEITELTPDAVLGRGPYDSEPPTIDRYNAVMDGQQAYMVAGSTPAEARCVFSTAIIEALWGHRDDAFDANLIGKVTPESLDLFLRARMKEISIRYRLKCRPDNNPGTPRDHLTYFDRAHPPAGPIPPAPAWPVPSWEQVATARDAVATPLLPSDEPSSNQLQEILGAESGRIFPGIVGDFALESMPASATEAVKDLVEAERLARDLTPNNDHSGVAHRNVERARELVQAEVVDYRQRKQGETIRDRFEINWDEIDRKANLIVVGGRVARVWSNSLSRVLSHRIDQSEFKLDVDTDQAEQVLVEFEDGIFASAMIYDRLATVLVRDDRGVIGWACLDMWLDAKLQLQPSIDAIAKLQLGTLTARQVDILAAELRNLKHINPVLGAVCAYLYDHGGDVDSIRRMAYFYTSHQQPIPFDIAFLGLLPFPGHRRLPSVIVPDIQQREPGLNDAELPPWVKDATPTVSGVVAGCWPWLRQGWDFVVDPEPPEEMAAAALQGLAHFLLPSPFTSFSREGGERAIQLFDMREQQ